MNNENSLWDAEEKIKRSRVHFSYHKAWPDDNDIISSIMSRAHTERGDIIIEVQELADFKIFEENIEEVERLLYYARDLNLREMIKKLDPGKYLLARSPSTHDAVFQRDDSIIDDLPPRVDFEKEIDPQELSHCHGLQFIPFRDLVVEDLGHGLGVATFRGEKLFLKRTGRKPKEFFIRKVTALHRLSHPNIIALRACALNDSQRIVGFLTEFSERGDLYQHQDAPAWLKKAWILQVADALQYIRREGIEYQDVKCGNIVVIEGVAKIVDFDGGCSIGHFKEGFESFPFAVLLEALGVPDVDELIREARTTPMPFDVFQTRLAAISFPHVQAMS